MESCAANEHSTFRATVEGLADEMQNIVVSWHNFEAQPNRNAIIGFVWAKFALGEE